jgi:diguanylate cyclase (GGDEF)-like protein
MPSRKTTSLLYLFTAIYFLLAVILIYINIHFQNSRAAEFQYSSYIMVLTSLVCCVGMIIASVESIGKSWYVQSGWVILMTGFVFDTAGNILGVIGFPSSTFPLFQYFYLASYSLVAIGLLFIPSNPRAQKLYKRQYLDIVVFVIISVIAVWVFLIIPNITRQAASLDQAYIAIDYLMVVSVFDLLIRRKHKYFEITSLLFACGIGTIVFGHILLIINRGGYYFWDNLIMMLAWLLSDAAFCIAAVRLEFAGRPEIEEGILEEKLDNEKKNEFLLPVFWVALAYIMLVWSHYNQEVISFPVLVFGTGSLISLLIFRLIETLHENSRLIETAQEELRTRKNIHDKLLHDTRHDSLTKLPNRSFLMDQLKITLETAQETNKTSSALFFLDLDNFKLTNDGFGHYYGDELLKIFAERLIFCVRPDDFVARLGGDEFAIMLNNLQTSKTVYKVADRILEKMKEPFEIEGIMHSCGVSFGIAYIFPAFGSPEEILKEADRAMYRAKRKGRGQFDVSSNLEF